MVGPKVSLHCFRFPREHPFNRDGYRYILAEADPHSPFRQVTFTCVGEGVLILHATAVQAYGLVPSAEARLTKKQLKKY